jgi:hypothetical protein
MEQPLPMLQHTAECLAVRMSVPKDPGCACGVDEALVEIRDLREENKRLGDRCQTYADDWGKDITRHEDERDALAAKLETARGLIQEVLLHEGSLMDGHAHLVEQASAFLEGGE